MHFVVSLEKQNITAFPIQKIKCYGSKVRHSTDIPIHCIAGCQNWKMIECGYCETWYLIDLCVSVSSDSQQPHYKVGQFACPIYYVITVHFNEETHAN